MYDYDCLIAGSGVSGMTLSLLLAMSGKRVLVLEKGSRIGGSLQRFRREGIPFDTGFHFTTALKGCFGDMFRFLGIRDVIQEEPVRKEVYFGDKKLRYTVPSGLDRLCKTFEAYYPESVEGIRSYIELQKDVYQRTPLFELEKEESPFSLMNFDMADTMTTAQILDRLQLKGIARMMLPSFAVCCCGTPVTELPFGAVARIGYGLYDDLVRFKGGGDSVVRRYQELAKQYGIEIRTGVAVSECLEATRKACHRVRLTDGSEVTFEDAVFTMHPKAIDEILPEELKSQDFRERLASFEEGCGFFSVFAVIDRPLQDVPVLSSYMTHSDGEHLMDPAHPEIRSLCIMIENELSDSGKTVQTMTLFENVYEKETEAWKDCRDRKHNAAYLAYKQKKTDELLKKVWEIYPELEGHVRVLETASMLTYRDYLSPYGSAYGIRQKTGQFNLFGRLPVRNFYAAGQNALLPGAMGAMQSGFILARKLIGEKKWSEMLRQYHERNTVS